MGERLYKGFDLEPEPPVEPVTDPKRIERDYIEKLKAENLALARRKPHELKHGDFLITLIMPPFSIDEVYGKYKDLASFQPPVGLCTLASYLIQQGYKVKIIDANVGRFTLNAIVEQIEKNRPRIIGVYTITPNFIIVEKLVEQLKEKVPTIPVIAGGPHVNFMPKESLEETKLDYVCVGEGEETLHELVEQIRTHQYNLSSIDGLAWRDGEKIVINKSRTRKVDLDHLPFPAVHLLPDIQEYKLYLLQHKRQPFMTIITSRGCPYKCVFCDTPFGKKMSYNSPAYTVAYIEYLKEQFGIKEVHFVDDTFTLKESRTREMCDLMIKRKSQVSWYAATRADMKDKTLFKKMKEAGCWIVAIGAETGNQEIMTNIGKNTSIEKIQETAKLVRGAGLKLKVFFILGNPGETVDTIDQTIEFARKLNAHYPVFSLMTPFPGAPLWYNAEQFGQFDRKNFRKLLISTSDPLFVPNGFTKELLLEKQKEAFRKVYYNPAMVIRQLYSVRTVKDVVNLARAFIAFVKLQCY